MTNSEAREELYKLYTGTYSDTEYIDFKCFEIAIKALKENDKLKAEIEKLKAELEQSVKLPCKRSDIVYFIKSAFSFCKFPISAKVVSVNGINCDGEVMYSAITDYNGLDRRFTSKDIGVTVFLTQEDAEQALKGGSEMGWDSE